MKENLSIFFYPYKKLLNGVCHVNGELEIEDFKPFIMMTGPWLKLV